MYRYNSCTLIAFAARSQILLVSMHLHLKPILLPTERAGEAKIRSCAISLATKMSQGESSEYRYPSLTESSDQSGRFRRHKFRFSLVFISMFLQRQVLLRSVGLTRRMIATTAGSSSSAAAAPPTTKKDEEKKLRIVVAVGGNALQRRGDRLTIENMLKAAAAMAPTMSELSKKHQLGKCAGIFIGGSLFF